MIAKLTMRPSVVLLFLVYLSAHALGDHGDCAKKCQLAPKDGENRHSSPLPFPCSCSPSCVLYKDCCYDSLYRQQVTEISDQPPTICLSLSRRGEQYRAVAGCPKTWQQSSRFCTGSVGYLPPVTSRTTGTTYANIHCASCNGEDSVDPWPVELRCCPEHNFFSERRFVYNKGQMWSQVAGNKCPCRFHSHNNDYSFLKFLEVRTCDTHRVISKCSSSWEPTTLHTKHVLEECSSFLEPVFIGGTLYRNRFCAHCNYKITASARCLPAVVESMASSGVSQQEIFRVCLENRYVDCLDYLSASGRGGPRKFSSMFSISEKSCLPPEGKRCCKGEIHDSRRNVCRKRRH